MISSPLDYPALDVETEWRNLQGGLAQLPAGLVQVKHLERASLAELHQQLTRDSYHIFHYIGHGAFDEHSQTSFLMLEDDQGRGLKIEGEKIGVHLHNHPSLRLAIINACEGARAAPHDLYTGLAQGLIRCEIPAVIGMQFEISDKAAIAFTGGFYDSVARGRPVDESLDEARRAIHAVQNGGSEWGTPVLYMRALDGCLFNIKTEAKPQPEPVPSPDPSSILVTPPKPVSTGPAVTGTLDSDSPYYIDRPSERKAIALAAEEGLTLVILAPGQCGGSSLLNRMAKVAEDGGKRSVYVNFQDLFGANGPVDAQDLYRALCSEVTNGLGLEDRISTHWERYSGTTPPRVCTAYMQSILQPSPGEQLFLALDETDLLFETPLKSDFFAMLRSWHNSRPRRPEFRRLGFVFLTSIDRGLLIDGPNQSGFNVGQIIYLEDFDKADFDKLASRYGLRLDEKESGGLIGLLAGHPVLHQIALQYLAETGATVATLLASVTSGKSPFRAHLESHYANLRRVPALYKGVETILKNGEPDETVIMQLRRAGLILREGNKVRFRCRLYEDYFREQFRMSKK
jgi:hypothetical protein